MSLCWTVDAAENLPILETMNFQFVFLPHCMKDGETKGASAADWVDWVSSSSDAVFGENEDVSVGTSFSHIIKTRNQCLPLLSVVEIFSRFRGQFAFSRDPNLIWWWRWGCTCFGMAYYHISVDNISA